MELWESDKALSLLLIVASTMLGTIQSNSEAYRTRGRVMFQLIRYSNPDDQSETGESCANFLSGTCDPYFQICVAPSEDDECSFIDHTSKVYRGTRLIEGDGRGLLTQPLTKLFTDPLPMDFYVKVNVREYDDFAFNSRKITRQFQMKIRSLPLANNSDLNGVNATVLEMMPTNPKSHLKIRLWVKVWSACEENYYGDQCEILCQSTEQYTCDMSGSRVCKRGWSGADCSIPNFCIDEEIICAANAYCINKPQSAECFCNGKVGPECYANYDFCGANPCLNGGQCSRIPRFYACQCSSGFRGDHCEIRENPCSSRPCQNGGECYAHSSGSFYCNCPAAFGGKQCENGITTGRVVSDWPASSSVEGRLNGSVVPLSEPVMEPLISLGKFHWVFIVAASVVIACLATSPVVAICFWRLKKKRHIKEIRVYEYEVPMISATPPQVFSISKTRETPQNSFAPPPGHDEYVPFTSFPVTYVRTPANENLYEECEPVPYPSLFTGQFRMPTPGQECCERSMYETSTFNERPQRSPELPSTP